MPSFFIVHCPLSSLLSVYSIVKELGRTQRLTRVTEVLLVLPLTNG